jgi:hypothetical protein
MPTVISRKPNQRSTRRRNKQVVLTTKQYKRMQQELEDLQDALAFETARRTARGFTLLEDFIKELQVEGKLKS